MATFAPLTCVLLLHQLTSLPFPVSLASSDGPSMERAADSACQTTNSTAHASPRTYQEHHEVHRALFIVGLP